MMRLVAVLCLYLGCAGSSEGAAAPETEPQEPAPVSQPEPPAMEPQPVASANPCDQLDPKVFDVTDIEARTDIGDAEKDRLRAEQAARRKVLFECFERAMKEKEELEKKSP